MSINVIKLTNALTENVEGVIEVTDVSVRSAHDMRVQITLEWRTVNDGLSGWNYIIPYDDMSNDDITDVVITQMLEGLK